MQELPCRVSDHDEGAQIKQITKLQGHYNQHTTLIYDEHLRLTGFPCCLYATVQPVQTLLLMLVLKCYYCCCEG